MIFCQLLLKFSNECDWVWKFPLKFKDLSWNFKTNESLVKVRLVQPRKRNNFWTMWKTCYIDFNLLYPRHQPTKTLFKNKMFFCWKSAHRKGCSKCFSFYFIFIQLFKNKTFSFESRIPFHFTFCKTKTFHLERILFILALILLYIMISTSI